MSEFNFGENQQSFGQSPVPVGIQRAQLQYPLDAQSEGALKLALENVLKDVILRSNRVQLTLVSGSTSFNVASNYMVLTAQGACTIATIGGGREGMTLTLEFTDANVTITDTGTGAAETVNLSAAFTSSANDIIQLKHNGTSWREVGRQTTGVGSTVVNYISHPVGNGNAVGNGTFGTNTTQTLGLVNLPAQITVNSLTVAVNSVNTAGTLDLVVYSEDGQTKHIDVTTASISASGDVSTAVSAVVLAPGNYWFAVNPNGTASIVLRVLSLTNITLQTAVSGEAPYAGTQTITAGVPAATFTPSALTGGIIVPVFRLDN